MYTNALECTLPSSVTPSRFVFTGVLTTTRNRRGMRMRKSNEQINNYKKLSYHLVTARCVLSVVILPIATQLCRNYLYDKS